LSARKVSTDQGQKERPDPFHPTRPGTGPGAACVHWSAR
jgi:hypothetical protein